MIRILKRFIQIFFQERRILMELKLIDINKSFSGKHILKDVSFVARSGKPLGFLGRNGAGKTTTIRILMQVFNPDSGQVLLDGEEFDRSKYKIGYMPEERGLYPNVSVGKQLYYLGKLKGMETSELNQAIEYWLGRFELLDYKNKNLETLSKGNQQKIQIIQSVINDPDILILDEPFSGLDPVNAQSLSQVIIDFVEKDRIVIFSSHQMSSVEEFCDDIVLINNGEIILNGSLNKVKAELGHGRKRLIIKDMSQEELKEKLLAQGDFHIEADRTSLIVDFNMPNAEVLSVLAAIGGEIELFSDYKPSLNDIFIAKVGEAHA